MKRNNQLISSKYLEYFVPTVLTAMATNFAAIVDSGIVGNLMDSTALSVINILLPVVQIYASISILFGIAGSVIIATARGRAGSDTISSDRAFTVICTSLLGISVILLVLQLVFMDDIISVLTPVESLRPLVREYYIPVIFATPVTLLMSSLVHIIRTDNRPKFATLIIIVANTVNLIFDIIFIRFFHLGLTGASLATVIGSLAGLIIVISHFRSDKCSIHWYKPILRNFREFFQCFSSLLANGISGAIGMILSTAKLLFLNLLIQHYGGKPGIVAFSTVSFCMILESAFVTGGCQAMVPIVSLLYGEKDYTGIRMAFRKALQILTVCSIGITALIEIFPQLPALVYGIDKAEVPLTVTAIRICAPMLIGDALTFLFIYLYMCTENKSFSTLISVLNGIVLIIPIGLLSGRLFGINGIWAALTISQFAALLAVIVGAIWLKRWRNSDSIYLLAKPDASEVLAFSANSHTSFEEVIQEVTNVSTEDTGRLVGELLSLVFQNDASSSRLKLTDVRIVKSDGYIILIKNNGAILSKESLTPLMNQYPTLQFVDAVGFKIISAQTPLT